MTKAIMVLFLVLTLAVPANATELTAPKVPESGSERMPQNTDSFGDALVELLQRSIAKIRPDLKEAAQVSVCVISAVLVISLLELITEGTKMTVHVAGAAVIAGVMFQHTNSMIQLASRIIWEICEYGKLLCPVLAAALAAQGGVTSSAALYAGTTIFNTLLSTLISRVLIPLVSVYLAIAVANSALGEELLKKIGDFLKGMMGWLLKTLLIIFTTYMSITGAVSGTTDALTLKAAKITISSVVPVVGSILSDASEAVLVSMGTMKNAAGVYGILAILAVFLDPFLKVGIHYLLLKVSAALCGIFGSKQITGLVDDFTSALGLLLAMLGSVCVLLLISTVCFMKGAG